MKKRISAIALCLALLFSFSFSAAAVEVDSADTGAISGSIDVDGSTVTVQVDLNADTGVTNGKVSVSYDTAVYTLVSAALGATAEAADISDLNTENDGVVSAAWATTTADTDGGSLLTVVLASLSEDGDVSGSVTITPDELWTEDEDIATEEDSVTLSTVDKTALQTLYNASLALEEENYTEGWDEFVAAQEAALAVLNDENATQAEVDAAYDALAAAIQALEAIASEDGADKSALQAAYDASLELNEEDYTEDSWSALVAAQETAKAVLDNEDAAQDEIDEALAALLDAIKGLTAATSTSDNAKTGDSSPVVIVAVVAVLAAAGAVVLVLQRKRRNA